MFIDYIYSVAPRSVKVKVSPMHGGESYVCPIDLPAYRAAEKGYELAFGNVHWQYVVEEVSLL